MILIVDDHRDSCDVLQRLLARRGLQAQCATSAREARRAMKQLLPDLVVLDDMMPDESGLALLQEMKHDPAMAGVKVLFYSAIFDYERQREAQRLGAKDWL